MSASIYDVAREAGVSIATVSRVLNTPNLVKPKTMERVAQAMEMLEYEPSAIARGLAQSNTGLVGLYLPFYNSNNFDFWYSDYNQEFLRGIIQGIDEKKYSTVLITDNEEGTTGKPSYVKYISQRRIDGIIIATIEHMIEGDYGLSRLLRGGFPVAYIGKRCGENGINVYSQYHKYMYQAFDKMWENGHTQFLITQNVEAGRAGKALMRYNEEKNRNLKCSCLSDSALGNFRLLEEEIYKAVKDGITCIFLPSLVLAENILGSVLALGLSIPEDISVIGVEHKHGVAKSLSLPISSFYIPSVTMGRTAAELLMQQISGKELPQKEVIFTPVYNEYGSVQKAKNILKRGEFL